MNPGDAEVVDTKTSSEIEEGGEKHKAPDERRRPVKTINDMKSIARDKEYLTMKLLRLLLLLDQLDPEGQVGEKIYILLYNSLTNVNLM